MGLAAEKTSDPSSKSHLAFRTISEVAAELNLPQHVLRFWESRFYQVQPTKKRGGRRYYRPEDITLLRRIRSLLYDEGYTIKGVQNLLKIKDYRRIHAVDWVPSSIDRRARGGNCGRRGTRPN